MVVEYIPARDNGYFVRPETDGIAQLANAFEAPVNEDIAPARPQVVVVRNGISTEEDEIDG